MVGEGAPAYFLLLLACLAGGFAEELVMRGYLIARLERLLGSTWLPVLVTSVLFASYHLYQGVNPAIGHFASGLVYAVSFCFLRRLWPLCIAHALVNFLLYL
jgi:membrane protease YdiL (CAAX protease family)